MRSVIGCNDVNITGSDHLNQRIHIFLQSQRRIHFRIRIIRSHPFIRQPKVGPPGLQRNQPADVNMVALFVNRRVDAHARSLDDVDAGHARIGLGFSYRRPAPIHVGNIERLLGLELRDGGLDGGWGMISAIQNRTGLQAVPLGWLVPLAALYAVWRWRDRL